MFFPSISSPIFTLRITLKLKSPTDPLDTHLEFNTSHFIIKFIWIFLKSFLPESSEVFLLSPVVTKRQVKQSSWQRRRRRRRKNTQQANFTSIWSSHKMKLKKAKAMTIWSTLHCHWRGAPASAGPLLAQSYLKLTVPISRVFQCPFHHYKAKPNKAQIKTGFWWAWAPSAQMRFRDRTVQSYHSGWNCGLWSQTPWVQTLTPPLPAE